MQIRLSISESLPSPEQRDVSAGLGLVQSSFLKAVEKRRWRAVVDMRCTRLMENGKPLKSLYRHGNRGQQVRLVGIDAPLTVSWFWLKRSEGKRELRFVASTYPYSGAYLVQLGRQR